MIYKASLMLIVMAMLIACSPANYKKADLGFYGGRTGYLEKEVREGVYVLEYSQIGGYNYNLDVNKRHWETRAEELCPNGYSGSYEVVDPINAKIDEFVCSQRFCGKYPLVSGVIHCK